ncbi:hypothetical protein RND81_11G194400 [Saponaria officinalis]|uniref:Uncharacterized protein n=1 Tax=Saponaria officinalis TaxID=3572 RepID=A0AAW1HPA6_SAPOF
MAETFLPFAIQHIESKIEGSDISARVKYEAKSLLSELKSLNRLLVEGERRTELSTNHEGRRLLVELRSITYDAEDDVDTAVVKYSALSYFFGIGDIPALKKLRRLNARAREVKRELDQHFEGSHTGTVTPVRGSRPPMGHLPADGDLVIGIDDEISRVVTLLTTKSNDGQKAVDKLAIVGMGGSGKTTLARSIYNHKVVKKCFQFQAWVSVSQGWDTSLMLRDILTQFRCQNRWSSWFSQPGNCEELENESHTLVHINNLLYRKNCLLVLDDVWDSQSLHKFIDLIQGDDGNDSRTYTIIITTRQTPSFNHVNWHIHQPERLADEDCWELFSKMASNSSKPLSEDFRGLSIKMLMRCQGLPLAIVALARRVKTKVTMRDQQMVLSTPTYGLENEILGLSYEQLPHHLKPCFLYLGLFPEGSAISGGTLIRMWIAEGFIGSNSEEKLEISGRRYLQELIDHTMVQVMSKTYSGKVKTIRIHDTMRGFCVFRARELEFLEVHGSGPGPEAIEKTPRRGAISLSLSNTPIVPNYNAHLRTLAVFENSSTRGVPERNDSQVSQRYRDVANLCHIYTLLRVLDIYGINSIDGTFPKEIGNLIQLTYLRIRSTNFRQLPRSIGKLRNLLTLDYQDVNTYSEIQVPNVLWKLKRLRHLYLPKVMSASVEDLKLYKLKDLITLWGVGGGRWMLKEIGRLSCTLSKLYIHRISDEDQLKAVLNCTAMMENDDLYALALDWHEFEIKSLDALASKRSLRKLRLNGKAPDKLCPQERQFPTNLGKLELYNTQLEKPETMAHLGKLLCLKVLVLSKDSYIGSEWICDNEAFPVLEELKLISLQKLEEWEIEERAMRCLKKLSIISCIKLKRIPQGLVHVRRLEKLDIERMPSSFVTKLQKVKEWNDEERTGEHFHIIKHVPMIGIRDSYAP